MKLPQLLIVISFVLKFVSCSLMRRTILMNHLKSKILNSAKRKLCSESSKKAKASDELILWRNKMALRSFIAAGLVTAYYIVEKDNHQKLYRQASGGSLDGIRALAKDKFTPTEMTQIFVDAIYSGNDFVVNEFLYRYIQKVDLDLVHVNKFDLVYTCLERDYACVAHYLIRHDFIPDLEKGGKDLLWLAIEKGEYFVAILLLNRGYKCKTSLYNHEEFFMAAVKNPPDDVNNNTDYIMVLLSLLGKASPGNKIVADAKKLIKNKRIRAIIEAFEKGKV